MGSSSAKLLGGRARESHEPEGQPKPDLGSFTQGGRRAPEEDAGPQGGRGSLSAGAWPPGQRPPAHLGPALGEGLWRPLLATRVLPCEAAEARHLPGSGAS